MRSAGDTERNSHTMTLPTLTAVQREEALRKAQTARTARKELLTAIAAGEQNIPAVLDRAKTDTIIGRTKIIDLVKSLPGYGPAKATALLEQTGIVPSRRRPGRAAPEGQERGQTVAGTGKRAGEVWCPGRRSSRTGGQQPRPAHAPENHLAHPRLPA
jgi:hypothetical protein